MLSRTATCSVQQKSLIESVRAGAVEVYIGIYFHSIYIYNCLRECGSNFMVPRVDIRGSMPVLSVFCKY